MLTFQWSKITIMSGKVNVVEQVKLRLYVESSTSQASLLLVLKMI